MNDPRETPEWETMAPPARQKAMADYLAAKAAAPAARMEVPNVKDFAKPEDYAHAYLQWMAWRYRNEQRDRDKAVVRRPLVTQAGAPPESPERIKKRMEYALRRAKRVKDVYGKDVVMVDPTLATHLIEGGYAVSCKIRDFETSDPRFLYEPQMHQPIRIRKLIV